MPRIAIIDEQKCRPEKCAKECIKSCPPQSQGKHVIEIEDIGLPTQQYANLTDKRKIAKIAESLCIGCNLCVNRCPFKAIKIINLPEELPNEIVHRYGKNGFRLYRMPIIKPNTIIGIIGENGVGKTTLIEMLSGHLVPNFEMGNSNRETVLTKFRGSVTQTYFGKLYNGEFSRGVAIKEQKIRKKLSTISQTVREYITNSNTPSGGSLIDKFNHILDTNLHELSGGELQRLMCYITAYSDSNVYIFDEPSNFLDIKQRMEIANLIRTLKGYVIVIEHDLSVLDYIADDIFIVYGVPSAYGIVSKPLSALNGINDYLDGFLSSQNIRFRPETYTFHVEAAENVMALPSIVPPVSYDAAIVEYPNFKLTIPEGKIEHETMYIALGQNGTGKSTYITHLAKTIGNNRSDAQRCEGTQDLVQCTKSDLTVSVKPQELTIEQLGLCRQNLHMYIKL